MSMKFCQFVASL